MTTAVLPAPKARRPVLSSEVLGTVLFVIAEIMMFTGLISGFIVLRSQFINWPPAGQPRLPAEATALNSLFLLASGVSAWMAPAAARAGDARRLTRLLAITMALGAAFLVGQGREWLQLVEFGLTIQSSPYGGLFVTIVGAHAVHVIFAQLVAVRVTWFALRGEWSPDDCAGLDAFRVYWSFVVAIWPCLYALVYLW